MANSNGWGDGAANNQIGWGKAAYNAIGWGDSQEKSWSGLTDIVGIATDSDAQAFISAASITNPIQQSSIDTLVKDLKSYNIWTKMKAIYPFVGGTASAHKYNLKDPRDLDAAFRLVFNGGWTHSINGATPNGTNGFADTKFIPSSNVSLSSFCFSAYSRTSNDGDYRLWGILNNSLNYWTYMNCRTLSVDNANNMNSFAPLVSLPTDLGLRMSNRNSLTQYKVIQNTTSNTIVATANQLAPISFYFGAANGISNYSKQQLAFAHLSDGLTDTEAANLYTAVQTFNQTLSRQVGVPIVSDSDAQAFLNSAEITDITQANAINNLVVDLKAQGLWSKMKAVYPFVGGTASSHKFNLKDPRDLDAAYRLVFNGGWTHSSTGATPNGTNGWADTNLNPSGNITGQNSHISFYSRTQSDGLYADLGYGGSMELLTQTGNILYADFPDTTRSQISNTNSTGLFIVSNTSTAGKKVFRNNSAIISSTFVNADFLINASYKFTLSNYNNLSLSRYSNRQNAFTSIGDGLTDAESLALYNVVNNYQVALSRNV